MSNKFLQHRRRRFIVPAALIAAVVALVAAAASSSATAPPKPKQATAGEWRNIVAKAKQEGTLTIYEIGTPANHAKAAAAFKAKYGINVVVNRNVDAVIAAQLNADKSTGKNVADIFMVAGKPLVLGALKNGWVTDAVGPNFFKKKYDRKKWMLGKSWSSGGSILGLAWNTKLAPTPVNDIPDLFTPAWVGKVAVSDPSVSTVVMDWYLWLDKQYGAGTMEKLAALKPEIAASALTTTQAVVSGEVAAAPFATPSVTVPAAAAGAPVSFKLLKNNWNAPYFNMILKGGPHPNAAQLYANWWISDEGQTLENNGNMAVYPNLPGTYYAPPRRINVNDFTPAKIKAFQAKWNSLFRH